MNEQEIYQYIEMTPFRGRKPVFRGTNITVEHVIDDLAKGLTVEEILKEHEALTAKHIQAVFVYVQAQMREWEILRLAYAIK
ncbi:MAG TPA: DUF433 domain-containing protein [Pyrinomonadaceae bacterium]|jgi:uncharacterized protein (DUF433 family)